MIPTDFGNNLAFYFDSLNSGSLWKDTAATIPVTVNGDTVKCWTDQSVLNPHNATEATNGPTYLDAAHGAGGTPSLKFNGTNQKLTAASVFPSAFAQNATIYCVCGNNTGNNLVAWGDGGGSTYFIRLAAGPNYTLNGLTARTITIPYTAPTTYGMAIESFRYDGAKISYYTSRTNTRRDLLAGAGLSWQQITQTGNWTPSGALSIGNLANSSWWDGEIKMLLGFTRPLTNREHGLMLDYISSRIQIANKPFVLCVGDSITDGYNVAAGSSYPEVMQVNLGTGTIVERSSSPGSITQSWTDWYENDILWRSWTTSSSGKQVAVMWPSNDIAVGNSGLETAKVNLRALAYRLRTDGFYVQGVTPLPRTESGNSAVYLAKRDALAVWMAAQTFFDRVTRIDLNPLIGVALAQNNPTYFQADLIHLTAAGDAVAEGLIRPDTMLILNGVTGPASNLGVFPAPVPTTITYKAVNVITGAWVTGDDANHTLSVITDGTKRPATAAPVSLGNGLYSLVLDATQMNGRFITVDGFSSTTNVSLTLQPLQNNPASGSGGTTNIGTIVVTSDTSGPSGATTAGNLSVKNSIGVGIGNSVVLAFITSEWNANQNTATKRGFALSKSDGSWTGMLLSAGINYTIEATDSNGFVYGPNTVQL